MPINWNSPSYEKVQIAASEKFTDPVYIVPIDASVSVCDQFKCIDNINILWECIMVPELVGIVIFFFSPATQVSICG